MKFIPVSLLTHLMATNQLQIQKVLDMSNKMNLVEYMSVKYAIIQVSNEFRCIVYVLYITSIFALYLRS